MYSKDTGKDQMLMTMERALTSGQKAGFFFLGFLGGIVGILAASLMNINAPYRPEGTKMAALGFATACVLGTLIALVGCVGSIALLGARERWQDIEGLPQSASGILPAAPIRSCEMRRGILRGCLFSLHCYDGFMACRVCGLMVCYIYC